MERFSVIIELFPQEGGWHFLRAPEMLSEMWSDLAERGLIALRARVGESAWDTSLMPMGDGTHFLALPARVRRAERLDAGDSVTAAVEPRQR